MSNFSWGWVKQKVCLRRLKYVLKWGKEDKSENGINPGHVASH